MDRGQLGRFEGGQPDPAPEVGVPQRLTFRASEDEPVVLLLSEYEAAAVWLAGERFQLSLKDAAA